MHKLKDIIQYPIKGEYLVTDADLTAFLVRNVWGKFQHLFLHDSCVILR